MQLFLNPLDEKTNKVIRLVLGICKVLVRTLYNCFYTIFFSFFCNILSVLKNKFIFPIG